MPRYQVIAPGFHGGMSYSPTGKRRTLTKDKAFKKCPSWLKPIEEESASQRKLRTRREAAAEKKAIKKAKEDKTDIDAVSFIAPPAATQVEAL